MEGEEKEKEKSVAENKGVISLFSSFQEYLSTDQEIREVNNFVNARIWSLMFTAVFGATLSLLATRFQNARA